MIFNVIDKNRDSMIGMNYVLSKVKIADLREFVSELYYQKYNINNFDRFNNGKEWLDENCGLHKWHIQERKRLQELLYKTGLEHNFFILYGVDVEQKGEGIETNDVYLIDGFRRLFFNLGGTDDEEVYVKIYYDSCFGDSEYMKLFYVVNLWKKQSKGLNMFFDRGFRLFLFVKYGIEIDFDSTRDHVSYLDLLTAYMAESTYTRDSKGHDEDEISVNQMNLLCSKFFLTDFKLMNETILEFDTIVDKHEFTDDFCLELFFGLGISRRKGFDKIVTLESFRKFLVDNKPIVDKIKKMSWTHPHVERIRALVGKFIEEVYALK